MSRIQKWMKILGHVESPKVSVQVGDKLEQLTDTQACRLEQITGRHSLAGMTLDCGVSIPPEDLCSLIEASFLSDIGEHALLDAAVSKLITLYADVKGLELSDGQSNAADTECRSMKSGHLALAIESCKEMATSRMTRAKSLVLPSADGASGTVVTLRFPLLLTRNTVRLRKSQLPGLSQAGQSMAN